MDDLDISVNNQQNSQQSFEKARKLLTLPRLIFVVLGVIILIEIIYVVRMFISSSSVSEPTQKQTVQSASGKILLSASKSVIKVNEVISVSVKVDSGGRLLDGADLIVHFDPKILEASQTELVKGKIFDEYPYVSVDTKNGLISISGINTVKKGFKGTGEFAILNLKAKAPGKTSLSVDFKKGSTTNSNLIETGTSTNILEQVGNLEINVQ